MKNGYWLILFVIMACKGLAQDIATVEYQEIDKYKKAHTTFIAKEADGFIYTLGSDKTNPTIHRETSEVIYLKKYSSDNFEEVEEWAFDTDDMGKGDIYFYKFTTYKRGFNVLLEVFRKKEDAKELYVKQISFDGKLLSTKKLFSVPSSKGFSRGFSYYNSPDSTKTLVYVDINPEVEEEKIPLIFVFNEDMGLVQQSTPRFSAEEKTFLRPVSTAVSNSGEAYVLAYSGNKKSMKGDGFITHSYAVSRMVRDEEVRNFTFEKTDIKIHGATLGFNKDDDLIINGFYSVGDDKVIEGNFYYLLDHKNLKKLRINRNSFEKQFKEKGRTYSSFLSSAYHFYEFSDFIVHEKGITLLAEQFYRTSSAMDPNAYMTKVGYYIIDLNPDGELMQVVPIAMNQSGGPSTFDKCLLTRHRGKTVLIFNDHQDNIKRRKNNDDLVDPISMAIGGMSVQIATIDAEGNIDHQLLLNKENFGRVPFFYGVKALLSQQDEIFGYVTAGMNILYLTKIKLN